MQFSRKLPAGCDGSWQRKPGSLGVPAPSYEQHRCPLPPQGTTGAGGSGLVKQVPKVEMAPWKMQNPVLHEGVSVPSQQGCPTPPHGPTCWQVPPVLSGTQVRSPAKHTVPGLAAVPGTFWSPMKQHA
jgi:hypothetical protein